MWLITTQAVPPPGCVPAFNPGCLDRLAVRPNDLK